MKTIIQQEPLHFGLQMAYRALSSGTTHPILTGILLTAQEGIIHLAATDLEKSIEVVIPASVEQPGSLVLPGREFNEIINRIPGGDITLSAPEDQHQAVISWRASEFVLNGYPADQFPPLPTPEDGQSFHLPAAALDNALSKTVYAASQDDSMPIISGVRLTLQEGMLQATSTDGYRIAVCDTELPIEYPGELEVVLPRRGISDLLRILASAGDDDVELALSENHIFLRLNTGIHYSMVVLEGRYPDVLSMVPGASDFNTHVTFDRDEFIGACSRTALLADDRKGARPVHLHIQDERLIFKAQSPELGEAYDEIEAQIEGDPLAILFQSKYLLDGIKHISDDRVRFSFTDAENAAHLQGIDSSEFSYIVLPMKPRQ